MALARTLRVPSLVSLTVGLSLSACSREPAPPPATAAPPVTASPPVVPGQAVAPPSDAAVGALTVYAHPTIAAACDVAASAAFFGYDSAALTWSDRAAVMQVAKCLGDGPLKAAKVRVVGRADPRGTTGYNRALGAARAQAVADALVAVGVDRSRVQVVSRGERGMAETGSPSVRALQRRVDVQLVDVEPVALRMQYWDYDGDGRVGDTEFLVYMSGMGDFEGWDRDGNGALTEAELTGAVYRAWDRDGSGGLDAAEFDAGLARWYRGAGDLGTFAIWDADASGVVERDEYDAGYQRNDLYDLWDRDDDGVLYESELAHAIYDYWDADGDGYLIDSEIDDYEALYWRRRAG